MEKSRTFPLADLFIADASNSLMTHPVWMGHWLIHLYKDFIINLRGLSW